SLDLKSHVEKDTASTNLDWCQLDDLIKMWILGSLYDSLQEQVVTTPGNAKALWDHLKELFHDNKDARALNLDNELHSIKIGKMTVNEYYTKIKFMADRLKNLGCVVSDKNFVIYTVNGLDSSVYASFPGFVDSRYPNHIIDSLHKEFGMTDLEALNYFLGISVVRHPTGLFLSQKKYALQLLEHGAALCCSQTYLALCSGHPGAWSSRICFATTSLVKYTDADWAGCSSTCSAKAEYHGVVNVVAETTSIRNLLRELNSPLLIATLVYCDNYADIFTKGLPSALFEDFQSSLNVRPPPAQTARAY
nr:hybrid signal transduction histidine kinase M [Tanacetum cinerariifolium]